MRWKRSETEQNADDSEKLLISAHTHWLTYLAELSEGWPALRSLISRVVPSTRPLSARTSRAALNAVWLAHLHFYELRDTAAQPLAEWDAARWMAVLCWQLAKERLATSENPELEDTRMRTERESGKLEWQTSADMANSGG